MLCCFPQPKLVFLAVNCTNRPSCHCFGTRQDAESTIFGQLVTVILGEHAWCTAGPEKFPWQEEQGTQKFTPECALGWPVQLTVASKLLWAGWNIQEKWSVLFPAGLVQKKPLYWEETLHHTFIKKQSGDQADSLFLLQVTLQQIWEISLGRIRCNWGKGGEVSWPMWQLFLRKI